jgi:hypothetical protein
MSIYALQTPLAFAVMRQLATWRPSSCRFTLFLMGASPWTSKHVGERVDSDAKYNDRILPPYVAAFRCISKMRRRFGENEHRIGSEREGVALRAGTQAANA